MRIWDYRLLNYLPDAQFKGQLRELVAIMHDWRDKGKTNHLLINKVMMYPKNSLTKYFLLYECEYNKRYGKRLDKYKQEFIDFQKNSEKVKTLNPFPDWHNEDYFNICMWNLYEKHLSIGKSHITNEEWKKLCEAYRKFMRRDFICHM